LIKKSPGPPGWGADAAGQLPAHRKKKIAKSLLEISWIHATRPSLATAEHSPGLSGFEILTLTFFKIPDFWSVTMRRSTSSTRRFELS